MTTESISFRTVFHRYLTYSEALSQYLTLEEEDRKIIEPYISHLKELWQEELKLVKTKLKSYTSESPPASDRMKARLVHFA